MIVLRLSETDWLWMELGSGLITVCRKSSLNGLMLSIGSEKRDLESCTMSQIIMVDRFVANYPSWVKWAKGVSRSEMVEILQGWKFPISMHHKKLRKKISLVGAGGFKMCVCLTVCPSVCLSVCPSVTATLFLLICRKLYIRLHFKLLSGSSGQSPRHAPCMVATDLQPEP